MVEFTANAGDAGDMGSIPGLERPLEKEIATHSNIPGKKKKILWTEEPGRLQATGSQKSQTHLSTESLMRKCK